MFNAMNNILYNGLCDVCKDEIYKKAIQTRVKSFVFQFDMENGINDQVGGYDEVELLLVLFCYFESVTYFHVVVFWKYDIVDSFSHFLRMCCIHF
jgi:hypothetical protein